MHLEGGHVLQWLKTPDVPDVSVCDINNSINSLASKKTLQRFLKLFLKCKLIKRSHRTPVTGFSQHFSEVLLAQPLQHEARY